MAAPKVLLVDDDAASVADLEPRLAALGYDVVAVATSGREAMELAQQTAPHLILIDISLGGELDGMETARALHRRQPTPILLLVSETDEASLRRVSASLHFGYLLRPFSDREIRAALVVALAAPASTAVSTQLEDRYFELSNDLLCCLGFDGHFSRLSPAWERTLGFSRQELRDRPFLEFVHPEDRERTLAQNREVRSGGQARDFENRYLCRDGSFRWLRWNAASDSSWSTVYAVARDVTEEKRAAAERERLVAELQAALAEVQSLRDILPICSYCRKVRDDRDYWQSVETYLARHTNTRFSHGICPSCFESIVAPQLEEEA